MLIPTLRRVTTEFDEAADRLRLTGELDGAPPVAMSLTQRLAQRLLPPLVLWLDQQSGVPSTPPSKSSRSPVAQVQKHVVHSFAQEAARSVLTAQPPVQAAPEGEVWLIQSVDLTPAEQHIALIFRGADGRTAGLSLTTIELRQWLAIIHALWRVAEWPLEVWPEWIESEDKPTGQQIILH